MRVFGRAGLVKGGPRIGRLSAWRERKPGGVKEGWPGSTSR